MKTNEYPYMTTGMNISTLLEQIRNVIILFEYHSHVKRSEEILRE